VAVLVLAVVPPSAAAAALAHNHPRGAATEDAEESRLGFIEDGNVDFVAARTHLQQCLADRFVNGLALDFYLFGHVA